MKTKFSVLALLSLGCSQAFGALVVDLDLGVLDIGEHAFEGDIDQAEGFDDRAQFYGTATQRYTSGEFVVSFTLEQEVEASLQSVLFTFGDPDAFLLDSLDTSGTAGNFRAEGFRASAFLDGALGSSAAFGVWPIAACPLIFRVSVREVCPRCDRAN